MPLYAPPISGSLLTPNVVTAECNAPIMGSRPGGYEFDKFYDKALAEITDPGDITAALAALGLTYSGTYPALFNTTGDGVWSLRAELTVVATPGGDDTVRLSQPSFLDGAYVDIGDPNTIGFTFLDQPTFMAEAGAEFSLVSACAGETNTPISQAWLQIIRLA